ncbi:MAG TPA: hypothetical protein VMH61_05855 [Candidatus Acidoferrales bacterium]|nr:hypothetical protein [Candidatus Acidoferrales bacterium]
MKRLIALTLALLVVSAGIASAGSLGLGAFAGMSYPVLQHDTGNGMLYGLRAPVKLVPFVTLEPYYATTNLGDKVENVAGLDLTQPGFDEKAWGVNLMLAAGGPLSFYPIGGVGQTSLSRTGVDQTFTTWNAGFGVGFAAVPKVTINLRGELQAVQDGSETRKFGNATVGMSYAIFGLP